MRNLTYQEERENNERIFSEMVQRLRPDLWVLFDLLDKTRVNPFILYKIIRQLYNVAIGSGWGEVRVILNDKQAMVVSGQDTDKMNEPVILQPKP